MARFSRRVGRKTIYWSDHALERWWERCEANELHGHQAALDLLSARLVECQKITRDLPGWADINRWHRARAEGFIYIDETSGFIINRNANGDYVAVTYIEKYTGREDADRIRSNTSRSGDTPALGTRADRQRSRRSDRGVRRAGQDRREQGRQVHSALAGKP